MATELNAGNVNINSLTSVMRPGTSKDGPPTPEGRGPEDYYWDVWGSLGRGSESRRNRVPLYPLFSQRTKFPELTSVTQKVTFIIADKKNPASKDLGSADAGLPLDTQATAFSGGSRIDR